MLFFQYFLIISTTAFLTKRHFFHIRSYPLNCYPPIHKLAENYNSPKFVVPITDLSLASTLSPITVSQLTSFHVNSWQSLIDFIHLEAVFGWCQNKGEIIILTLAKDNLNLSHLQTVDNGQGQTDF